MSLSVQRANNQSYSAHAPLCRIEAFETVIKTEIDRNGKTITNYIYLLGYELAPCEDVFLRTDVLNHNRRTQHPCDDDRSLSAMHHSYQLVSLSDLNHSSEEMPRPSQSDDRQQRL